MSDKKSKDKNENQSERNQNPQRRSSESPENKRAQQGPVDYEGNAGEYDPDDQFHPQHYPSHTARDRDFEGRSDRFGRGETQGMNYREEYENRLRQSYHDSRHFSQDNERYPEQGYRNSYREPNRGFDPRYSHYPQGQERRGFPEDYYTRRNYPSYPQNREGDYSRNDRDWYNENRGNYFPTHDPYGSDSYYGNQRPYNGQTENEGSYGRQGGYGNRGPRHPRGGFDEQRENNGYGYRGHNSNEGGYGSRNYDHPGYSERSGHYQYRGHEPWNDHEERGRFRGYPSQGYMNMGPFAERKYGNGDWNIGNYGSREQSQDDDTRYGQENGRRRNPRDERY